MLVRWAMPEVRGGPDDASAGVFLVSGIVFGPVALLHALRLAFRWQVHLRSQEIPMWLSGFGVVAAAGCASGRSGSFFDGSLSMILNRTGGPTPGSPLS